MATKKKPIVQGGVDNYLGNQPQVQAPRRWQSGPNKPTTELAYITEAEKDLILKTDLHGSLKKGPNIGPSGIMSLDSWGDVGGGGQSGADYDADPGGKGSFSGRGPNESARDHDRRKANERAVLQIAERNQADDLGYREREDISRFSPQNRGSGGLGNLLRGALGFFGGIPGRVMSGVMGAKNWAQRTGANIGEEFDEFGQYPTLDRYLNRNTDKYKDKPYRGQGFGYDFSDKGNNLELYTNRLNEPIGPGKRVGQDQGYYGMGSQYDQSAPTIDLGKRVAFNPGSLLDQQINQAHNIYNETGFGKGNLENLMKQDIENKEKTGEPLSLPVSAYTMFGADGGRAGYREGELVDEDVNIQGPGFDVNENVMMASDDVNTRILEDLFEKYLDLGFSHSEAEKLAMDEFEQMSMGPQQDQGLASLV